MDAVARARRSHSPDRPCDRDTEALWRRQCHRAGAGAQRGLRPRLGRAFRRPAIIPIPAFALRLLGDLADELLLGGQKVLPDKALASGFAFRHETLRSALAAILPRHSVRSARKPRGRFRVARPGSRV
jgi:hypothetical protein